MSSVIVLLGGPGSGKGTQAARLSDALSVPHVSTGDLFRANLKEGTQLGKRAAKYMNAGELVPDEVVLDMLFDHVAGDEPLESYILDGFPRTLPQAQEFDARRNGSASLNVVNLEVSDETIVERAAGRLVCRSCGNIQHARFAPPAREGVCDACGGELHQREDDRPEVIRERLRVYHEQTAPLVRFYESKGVLRSVDGERKPDAVFADLLSVVSGRS